MKTIKTPQNVHQIFFKVICKTFICDIKMFISIFEAHHVKLSLQILSIVQLFDFSTLDMFHIIGNFGNFSSDILSHDILLEPPQTCIGLFFCMYVCMYVMSQNLKNRRKTCDLY